MNRIKQLWYHARSTFWFLPGIIVCGAVVLAIVMAEVDANIPQSWLDRWPRVFSAGAEGSRGLLSAIANSMINVAGVVFSITLVALSLASTQYSSRVLRNFMRDSVNQSVLGVFVGIFAYCLIAMRTIRGDGEYHFIPTLSVLVGLILGFVGIGYLIFFIHHIAVSIQASHILAEICDETLATLRRVYPVSESECVLPVEKVPDDFGRHWETVPARATGYLQTIDMAYLVTYAEQTDTVIRWHYAVGDFVIQNVPLASIYTVGKLEPEMGQLLGAGYRVGRERTFEQDAAYGIRQLVDLALKALSPGINDTTTAIMALDYLTVILSELSERTVEVCYRNEQQAVRVLIPGPDFTGFLDLSWNQIRENAEGNPAVLQHMIHSVQILLPLNTPADRRAALLKHAAALEEIITRTIPAPPTRQLLLQNLHSILPSASEENGERKSSC